MTRRQNPGGRGSGRGTKAFEISRNSSRVFAPNTGSVIESRSCSLPSRAVNFTARPRVSGRSSCLTGSDEPLDSRMTTGTACPWK
jgi:hypothetical protein